MPEQAPVDSIGIEAYLGLSDFEKNAAAYEKMLLGLDKSLDAYVKSTTTSTAAAEAGWAGYADATEEIFSKADRELDKAKKAVADYADANSASLRTAETDWMFFSDTVVGQVAQMNAAIDGIKTLARAFIGPFKQAMGLAQQTAGIERSRRMFERMLGTTEDYNEEMEKMRAITKGVISDADLITSSFRVMSMGLADTGEQAAEVSRNVVLLAQAVGQISAPQPALDVFASMMSDQSRLRLDAFALTVSEVDSRIAHLTRTLGISKKEAFSVAVFELMEEKVVSMGLDVEDSAAKISRLNASWKNLSDNLKMVFAPELADFIGVLDWMFEVLSKDEVLKTFEFGWAQVVGSIRGATMAVGDFVTTVVFDMMALKEALQGNAEEARRYNDLADESAERLLSGSSYLDTYRDTIKSHFEEVSVAAQSSADIQAQAIGEVTSALDELIAKQQEYEQSVRGVMGELAAHEANVMSRSFYAVQDAMISASRQAEDVARRTAASIQSIIEQYNVSIIGAATARDSAIEAAHVSHSTTMLRIEENYQRAKRDILRKYDMDEAEAIRARDALALMKARRTRDSALEDAEDTRVTQESEANRAYAAQLVAAQKAYDNQVAVAVASYQKQMAALEARLQKEEEDRQLSLIRQEEDRKRAREREAGATLQATGKKLADLYITNQDEQYAMRDHYAVLITQLSQYYDNASAYYAAIARLRQMATSGGVGGDYYPLRQSGGYAGYGVYKLGERGTEFVLSSDTTRMLERLTGGMLTQSRVLSAAASQKHGFAAPGGSSTVNHVVSGEVATQVDVAVNRSISGMEGRINAALSKSLGSLFRGVRV